jgi:hypothetical protein
MEKIVTRDPLKFGEEFYGVACKTESCGQLFAIARAVGKELVTFSGKGLLGLTCPRGHAHLYAPNEIRRFQIVPKQ